MYVFWTVCAFGHCGVRRAPEAAVQQLWTLSDFLQVVHSQYALVDKFSLKRSLHGAQAAESHRFKSQNSSRTTWKSFRTILKRRNQN